MNVDCKLHCMSFVSSSHVDFGTEHAGLLSMNAILVGNKESPKNLQTIFDDYAESWGLALSPTVRLVQVSS